MSDIGQPMLVRGTLTMLEDGDAFVTLSTGEVVRVPREDVLRDEGRRSEAARPIERQRVHSLLESAAAMIDKHVPDLCGSRGVLTSQIRDAIKGKWDDGEWDDGRELRTADAPFVVGDVVTIPGTVADIFGDGTVRVRFAALGSNRFSMLLDASALRRERAKTSGRERVPQTASAPGPVGAPEEAGHNASQAPDERSRKAILRIAELVGCPDAGGPEKVVEAVRDLLSKPATAALMAEADRWRQMDANDPPHVATPSSCPDDCANHSDGAGGIIVSEGCPVHDRGGSGGS